VLYSIIRTNMEGSMGTSADFRSFGPEAQEAIRVRAVEAVKAGMRKSRAAEVFGVSRRAVSNWMRVDRQGGREALKAKPRGRPQGGGKLKPWQCATIVNLVVDRHPDQLKLPFYLWMRISLKSATVPAPNRPPSRANRPPLVTQGGTAPSLSQFSSS